MLLLFSGHGDRHIFKTATAPETLERDCDRDSTSVGEDCQCVGEVLLEWGDRDIRKRL